MLRLIYRIRFLLLPMAGISAIFAYQDIYRGWFAAIGAFAILAELVWYSSDEARIVFWLQGYRRIKRANPSLSDIDAKLTLFRSFEKSPKFDGSMREDQAVASNLEHLIADIIRIEFGFHRLPLDLYSKRVRATFDRVRQYAAILGVDLEEASEAQSYKAGSRPSSDDSSSSETPSSPGPHG